MALTRAQLIQGDSSQGTVLSNTVQGVKGGGAGVAIANDGTISFVASTSTGVVKLNNSSAYNNYVWPSAAGAAGTLLSCGAGGTLSWVSTFVSTAGLGTNISGNVIKVSIPTVSPAPAIGTSPSQAIDGSLYWDSSLGALFVRYNDGVTSQWVQATPTGGGGGGGDIPSGVTMLFLEATAPAGWTQEVTNNNKALRLVSGTGAGTGGSTSFTSVFTSRGVPLLEHTHVITGSPHHHVVTPIRAIGQGGDTWGVFGGGGIDVDTSDVTAASVASNAGTAGATMDFAVQYVDIIACTKD